MGTVQKWANANAVESTWDNGANKLTTFWWSGFNLVISTNLMNCTIWTHTSVRKFTWEFSDSEMVVAMSMTHFNLVTLVPQLPVLCLSTEPLFKYTSMAWKESVARQYGSSMVHSHFQSNCHFSINIFNAIAPPALWNNQNMSQLCARQIEMSVHHFEISDYSRI